MTGALLLLPILRCLAFFRVLGIQFGAAVRYHVWLGTAMVCFATIRGGSTLFIWGVSHYIQEEIRRWQKTGRIYLAGEIALVTALVIWITALPQIRRKRYDSLLLVAGGIGINPFMSILQEIASAQKSGNQFPTRIQLIYVVKKSQDICLLHSISSIIQNQTTEQLHLKLKVLVTQEQPSGAALRELLDEYSKVETVHFGTDGSSYAINGLESFLSMAAVAGLSFIVFLVFFNHIFIPNQKNKKLKSPKASKEKNSSSVYDLINIFSFVIAMICSTLVALILRWSRLKRETSKVVEKHVKSWKASSIEAGGGALDNHELHFTGRPNFQDIFAQFPTETGGSDVGVLVCGPETMKESVALFCGQNSQCFKTGDGKKTSFSLHPF